ncbi:MAG: SGNH/GDSL hydrolase family protein [Clostridia bacterium]|nr:SGNH/GDSL hydrolase family protein [Clostridia bacterium]
MSKKTFTVVGDSIPKGIITNDNQISLVKQNAVNIVEDYYKVTINNFSFYGQTLKRIYSKNILDQIITSLKQENTNYLIFSIGGNDADYNWQKVAEEPNKKQLPVTPIKEFKKILQKCITKLKNNNINVIITTMIPMDSTRYFENVISKKADKEKILAFLKQDLSNITRQHERYNMALIELAILNSCPIIDIRSQFLLNKNYRNYLCKDGIHPNEKGYKKIGNYIIKLTKSIFNKNHNRNNNKLEDLDEETKFS